MALRDTPWPQGTPCWIDVRTTDPDATSRFYGELFGWTYARADDGYLTAALDGRALVAQDPSGGAFCAWQARGHVDCEVVNEPGAFVWCELVARDYDAALAFYPRVFGVGVTDIGGGGFRFSTVEVDGDTVGGIGAIEAGAPPDVPSHWRTYFATADIDATVDAALALGAHVTDDAHDTPFGRWAALADPVGARFSVITPPA